MTRNVLIQAPIGRVWSALTVSADIAAWMEDNAAAIELRPGGRIEFFGGSTTGRVTLVEAPKLLEYTWRQAEWKKAWADSRVRWDLEPAGEATVVRLLHDGFPNQAERDSHDTGWDEYWLGPMLRWLEARAGKPRSTSA